MTITPNEPNPINARLSEIFGIDWNPDVMAYEEPHIFRSVATVSEPTEQANAEQ